MEPNCDQKEAQSCKTGSFRPLDIRYVVLLVDHHTDVEVAGSGCFEGDWMADAFLRMGSEEADSGCSG